MYLGERAFKGKRHPQILHLVAILKEHPKLPSSAPPFLIVSLSKPSIRLEYCNGTVYEFWHKNYFCYKNDSSAKQAAPYKAPHWDTEMLTNFRGSTQVKIGTGIMHCKWQLLQFNLLLLTASAFCSLLKFSLGYVSQTFDVTGFGMQLQLLFQSFCVFIFGEYCSQNNKCNRPVSYKQICPYLKGIFSALMPGDHELFQFLSCPCMTVQ